MSLLYIYNQFEFELHVAHSTHVGLLFYQQIQKGSASVLPLCTKAHTVWKCTDVPPFFSHRAYIHCVFSSPCSTHTPSITFRHLSPNSAGIGYATEGAPFISVQLSTDVVSALWKIWVLIRQTSSTGLRYPSNHCHSWLGHRSQKTVSFLMMLKWQ